MIFLPSINMDRSSACCAAICSSILVNDVGSGVMFYTWSGSSSSTTASVGSLRLLTSDTELLPRSLCELMLVDAPDASELCRRRSPDVCRPLRAAPISRVLLLPADVSVTSDCSLAPSAGFSRLIADRTLVLQPAYEMPDLSPLVPLVPLMSS